MYLRNILLFLVFSIQILFPQSQSTEIEKETWGYKVFEYDSKNEIYPELVCTTAPITTNGNWKISFDFSINNPEEYGFMFHLRDEDKEYSITTVYLHYLNPDTGYLNFYINNIKTNISIPLPKNSLKINNWFTLTLEYLQNDNSLTAFINNKLVRTIFHNPPENVSLKIIFKEKYTDALDFSVRDVRWFNRNMLLHHWKFNEREGTTLYDEIGSNNGFARNGEWLNDLSNVFKVVWNYAPEEKPTDARKYFVIDKDAGLFYFIEQSKIVFYNFNSNRDSVIVTKNKIPTQNIDVIIFKNNLALFHRGAEGEVSFFDSYTKRWSPINAEGDYEQHFYGSGFFADNNKIYSIGGYGWYRWKNTIRTYDINTRKWTTLNLQIPKNFYPRTISKVVPGINEHEWLISGLRGGGSPSGKQEDVANEIANLEYYTDLWSFNTITNKLIKISEYDGFSKKNYKGYLFFRKDSLLYYFCNKSSDRAPVMLVSKIGEPKLTEYPIFIPKLSDDQNNFYDLSTVYYNKKNNKVFLLVYIPYSNKYTLLSATFPPIYKKATLNSQTPLAINIFWNKYVLIFGIVAFTIIGYIAVKRIKKNNSIKEYKVFKIPKTIPQSDAVFLFGEVSILNKTGEDVLKKFTSQAEQLFLLILLHTISKKGGVAGDIIDELYYGVNSTPAIANKRSVGINRLRKFLSSYPELKIETSETIFTVALKDFSIIDLFRLQHYIDLEVEELINNQDILNDFCMILERGAFLPYLDFQWLDTFKEKVNEEVINKLTSLIEFLNSKIIKNSTEQNLLSYRIASIISIHDPLNEKALKIRINYLKLKGSLGLAEKIFRNFASEYKNSYGENYKIPFNTILEKGDKNE